MYSTKNLDSQISIDGVNSGAEMEEGTGRGGQIAMPDSVYGRMRKFIEQITLNGAQRGFRLERDNTIKKQDAGHSQVLNFSLTDDTRKVNFSLRQAGTRGSFLNAWWNPNKFLSGGQNVFPTLTVCREENSALGVEWKYLPHDLVEYPFRLLVEWLGEDKWPGKGVIKKALETHSVFWQRMDFTVYSAEVKDIEALMSVIEAAAKTKNFTGLAERAKGERSHEASIESLLGISYEDVGDRGYSYVRLNKRGHSKGSKRAKPVAFSMSMYLKEMEVRNNSQKGSRANLVALRKNPGLVTNRIRQEFTFYANGLAQISSLRRVAFGSEFVDGSCRTSGALLAAFPDDESFRRKIRVLILTAIKELQLDWLVTPKNPEGVAERAYEATKNALVKRLLQEWTVLQYHPLPSARKMTSLGTEEELDGALKMIRRGFGDIQTLTFEACSMLHNNMVKACLTREEYNELIRMDNQGVFSRRRAELLEGGLVVFDEFRDRVRGVLGYEPMRLQLKR